MTADPTIFDRRQWKRVRRRAAPSLAAADFLLQRTVEDIAGRIAATNRAFDRTLVIGDPFCALEHALTAFGKTIGADRLIHADLCPALIPATGDTLKLVLDEEALPMAPGSLDLIVSILTLHTVNDLPGALIQMRRALRPDGLFVAGLFGGDTLAELNTAFVTAETALEGGAGPHVSPRIDIRDLGHLLQRAGFALPVTDSDKVTVTHPSPLHLMRDLRAMGQTNILAGRRRRFLRRRTLMGACDAYQKRFAREDGRVVSTFEILYATGWAPSPDQQKPLPPGSARARLADALNTEERPLPRNTDPKRQDGNQP